MTTYPQLVDKLFPEGRDEITKKEALRIIGQWMNTPYERPDYHLNMLFSIGLLMWSRYPEALRRMPPAPDKATAALKWHAPLPEPPIPSHRRYWRCGMRVEGDL